MYPTKLFVVQRGAIVQFENSQVKEKELKIVLLLLNFLNGVAFTTNCIFLRTDFNRSVEWIERLLLKR